MVFLMRQSNGILAPTFYVFAISIPTLKIPHFLYDAQWVHIISELFYMLEIKVFVVFRPTLKFPYFMHEWIILYIPKTKVFFSSLHCPFVGKLWHDVGIRLLDFGMNLGQIRTYQVAWRYRRTFFFFSTGNCFSFLSVQIVRMVKNRQVVRECLIFTRIIHNAYILTSK